MFKRKIACFAVLACLSPAIATAQDTKKPKFEFKEKPDVEDVVWKASVSGSLVHSTGNSRTTTISGGAKASRKEKANKVTLEANGSFARSSIVVADDANGDGVIDQGELDRQGQTTADSWQVLGRYDRFLTARNALYALGTAGADRPAGKEFTGGGQVGYSRVLFQTDVHEVIAEAGYDFTYEALIAEGDGLAIHSVRGFSSYSAKIREDTGLSASLEALVNVNELEAPAGDVAPGEDARFTGTLEATTKLTSKLSLSASFKAHYDNAPAPLPPLDIPFADGFVPLADELDTTTKISLIVSLL